MKYIHPFFFLLVFIQPAFLLLYPGFASAQTPVEKLRIDRLLHPTRPDSGTYGKLYRLGNDFLERPGSESADLAAVRYIATELKKAGQQTNDSLTIGLGYLLSAKFLRESGQPETGRPDSKHALRLLTIYGTPDLQAQAVIELGGSYSNKPEDLPLKIDLYKQGAAIYQKMGRRRDEAGIKEFVGDLLMVNGQFTQAQPILQESLVLYESIKFDRLHGIYSLIALNHYFLYHFEEAFRFNLMAIATAEKLGEKGPLLATIYNRVGMTYAEVNYYSEALAYYNKSVALSRSNADTPAVKYTLLNIANALNRSGNYSASSDTLLKLTRLGKFEDPAPNIKAALLSLSASIRLSRRAQAEHHYKELLTHLKATETSEIDRQVIRIHIAGYLLSLSLFDESHQYIAEAYSNQVTTPIPNIARPLAERIAYQIDSAKNNMQGAFQHLSMHKYWADSLDKASYSKQIALLQVQFQTQQKNKDIQLLQQTALVQKATLKQEKTYRYIFFIGLVMLSILLSLVYNRYSAKRKTARILQQKQQEINQQNRRLLRLVDEKEWLLKEVHHRVKNNLQIVISLLNTQSKHLANEDAIVAIRSSQQRMYSMSLIHQQLYQNDNKGRIDMHWYISELTAYLKDSFGTGPRISFVIEVDDISLEVTQAIPVGLIINEAVSNAIKYAFPNDRKGILHISFSASNDQQGILAISDNGVGVPDTGQLTQKGSLGMNLMHGLAEQLDGAFSLQSDENGLSITLIFPIRSLTDDSHAVLA